MITLILLHILVLLDVIFKSSYKFIPKINQDFQVSFFVSKLSKESVGILESVIRISKKCISFAVLLIANSSLSNSGADFSNNWFVI